MRDKIEKLLAQIQQDFPDGCRGMNCTTCPLRSQRNGVKHHLCQTLLAQMHGRGDWKELPDDIEE